MSENQDLSELNQSRAESEPERIEASIQSNSGPNSVIYGIVGGVGLIADILGWIPLVGWLLAAPFTGGIMLWKVLTHQGKKSPAGKILANIAVKFNPISGWVPSNMLFVIYSYREHKKLAQTK
jgi:hypothetical protein